MQIYTWGASRCVSNFSIFGRPYFSAAYTIAAQNARCLIAGAGEFCYRTHHRLAVSGKSIPQQEPFWHAL
jgi:hypothetical protein